MVVWRSVTSVVTAVLVAGSSTSAAAQATGARSEAVAEIGRRLRSFYFNLAHHNWEALTADILAAKVAAHRTAPESGIVEKKSLDLLERSRSAVCSGSEAVAVEQAVITIDGDWADVTVPHCTPVLGLDEFRLIRFGGRWRFVGVHLYLQPADVTFER